MPGHKIDKKDSAWLCKLLLAGLLKPSYIPLKEQRDFSDLTCFRKKLIQDIASTKSRIIRILEDCNVKLSSILSSTRGVTAIKLIDKLWEGKPMMMQDIDSDSAYTGPKQEQTVASKEMENQVCEKGAKNRALTEEQKENNRIKSKVRSRVEHIFGFMKMSMNGMYLNNIGIKRITVIVGLMNLTYNMFRRIQLI